LIHEGRESKIYLAKGKEKNLAESNVYDTISPVASPIRAKVIPQEGQRVEHAMRTQDKGYDRKLCNSAVRAPRGPSAGTETE
jgi:hypothetical protein